jgi:DNA-directed RNA polymerase specialized sigma subunit
MKTEREIVRDYREIKEEYAWHPDIFTKDDERVAKVKEIINTKLSVVDKTIIVLYADCQSYRKLGKRLGVSHMTIRRECQRIKKIILEEFNNGRRNEGIVK